MGVVHDRLLRAVVSCLGLPPVADQLLLDGLLAEGLLQLLPHVLIGHLVLSGLVHELNQEVGKSP